LCASWRHAANRLPSLAVLKPAPSRVGWCAWPAWCRWFAGAHKLRPATFRRPALGLPRGVKPVMAVRGFAPTPPSAVSAPVVVLASGSRPGRPLSALLAGPDSLGGRGVVVRPFVRSRASGPARVGFRPVSPGFGATRGGSWSPRGPLVLPRLRAPRVPVCPLAAPSRPPGCLLAFVRGVRPRLAPPMAQFLRELALRFFVRPRGPCSPCAPARVSAPGRVWSSRVSLRALNATGRCGPPPSAVFSLHRCTAHVLGLMWGDRGPRGPAWRAAGL